MVIKEEAAIGNPPHHLPRFQTPPPAALRSSRKRKSTKSISNQFHNQPVQLISSTFLSNSPEPSRKRSSHSLRKLTILPISSSPPPQPLSSTYHPIISQPKSQSRLASPKLTCLRPVSPHLNPIAGPISPPVEVLLEKAYETSGAGGCASHVLHQIVRLQAQALADLSASASAFVGLPQNDRAGKNKKPTGDSETSLAYNLLAKERSQEVDKTLGEIEGEILASSPPPQTYLQQKTFRNGLEFYLAWLKGKYPPRADEFDQAFIILENAGFLYKSVIKESNHVRVKNVLIEGGVDGAEGLTCLLRDEVRSFWRSVNIGQVVKDNELHNLAGETQDAENEVTEYNDEETCFPSPLNPTLNNFGNVSQYSNSLDNVSSSNYFL